jgi:hypothetical protein
MTSARRGQRSILANCRSLYHLPQRKGITNTKTNKENGEADSRKVEAKKLIQIN